MFRCWSINDLATARTLIADDAQAWTADTAGASGREPNTGRSFTLSRWLDLLQVVLDLIPGGLEVVVHRMIADGGWVAAEIESRGELVDGRIYNMRYTFWFDVRAGRIHQLKQYFDTRYGEQFFVDIADQVPG